MPTVCAVSELALHSEHRHRGPGQKKGQSQRDQGTRLHIWAPQTVQHSAALSALALHMVHQLLWSFMQVRHSGVAASSVALTLERWSRLADAQGVPGASSPSPMNHRSNNSTSSEEIEGRGEAPARIPGSSFRNRR